MTALAGLPLYLDLAHSMGLAESISQHLHVRGAEFKRSILEVSPEAWLPVYKEAGGQRTKTGQEWAEVCFVPNAIARGKKGPGLRYLAIRESMKQREFPEMEEQLSLPFTALKMDGIKHKVFGLVTNMDWDGSGLISWHRERCGKSEEAHAVMKADLAGGKLPSGDFGGNAAWRWIMILALNLNAALKRFALGERWVSKRMKAVRFNLINLPGRIVERSRRLIIRLSRGHPSLGLLVEARRRIAAPALGPAG